MMKNATLCCLVLLSATTLAVGCAGGGGSAEPTGWEGDPGGGTPPPEGVGDDPVVVTPLGATLRVHEAGIRGDVDAGGVFVVLPLDFDGAQPEPTVARVEVWQIETGETVSVGELAFEVQPGASEVTVPLDTPPPGGVVERGGQVVTYTVTVGERRAWGRRSLYALMAQADVVLLVPPEADEGQSGLVRALVSDRLTGRALAATPLVFRVTAPGEEDVTVAAITDDFGTAVVEVGFPLEGTARVAVTLDLPQAPAALTGDVRVVRDSRLLLTTDKSFYQPGQTMHLRALALRRPDLAPAADQEMRVEVYDGEGNRVFKERLRTSDYGIAHTTFTLGAQVNHGEYRVVAAISETETEKRVQVRRYALPRFKVGTSLDRTWYQAGDTVGSVVSARYFFGREVRDAQVTVQASSFDVEWRPFQSVTGITDEEGVFGFEIRLPDYLVGHGLEQGGALVQLDIRVTDTAGHTEQILRPVVVADKPLTIVVVPESGRIAPGMPNRLFLYTQDPTGRPVAASCAGRVGEEDSLVETNHLGFGELEVTVAGETLVLELSCQALEGAGQAVEERVTLQADALGGLVLVRTDRALYEVGETLEVEIRTAEGRDRVYLDLLRGGVAVEMSAVEVNGGLGLAAFDLDATLAGDLLVEAYYVDEETGEILRDSKLVYVRSASSLDVTVAPDKERYAPAEEAVVRVAVRDPDGKPAQAALGVQVVDEAVLAMSEVRPGLLETYFRIEEAIATPHYQIKNASWDLASLVRQGYEESDDPAQQQRVEAAFAALDGLPTNGVSRIDWSEVDSGAQVAMRLAMAAERERIASGIRSWTEDGSVRPGRLEIVLSSAGPIDPWGRRYGFTLRESEWSWPPRLEVRSAGMDELADTQDDWTASFALLDFYTAAQLEDGGYPQPQRTGGGADAMAGPDTGGGWWAAQDTAATPADGGEPVGTEAGEGPRVRKWFPETLFVAPEVITDENGEAELRFPLADSITTWRMTTMASDRSGGLGSRETGIVVLQDFFADIDLPATLTRGDELSVPLVIYNYLETPETVRFEVEAGDWLELPAGAVFEETVDPGAVRSVHLPLRVTKVGWHTLRLTATGSTLADAIERAILVEPDGKRFAPSVSGFLRDGVTAAFDIPAGCVEGSLNLKLDVFPGVTAQVVSGMDSMLRMPHG